MKFFRKYPQVVLITLAMVFMGIIIAYYFWGIGAVVGQVNRAVNTKPGAGTSNAFNLTGARALNLRGLVSQ